MLEPLVRPFLFIGPTRGRNLTGALSEFREGSSGEPDIVDVAGSSLLQGSVTSAKLTTRKLPTPRSRSTMVDPTSNGMIRCQDLQGRCVAVIPGEMECDQTRYSLEYMLSYAEIGIQSIEVVKDLMGVGFKTIKVEYPLYLSLVPVGGDIADFVVIMMGMGCITTVDVRDQEAVGLEGDSVMNFVQNHARRLTDVSNERVIMALNGRKASIGLRVGGLQYVPTHWATRKGKLWGRPCGILTREVYPSLVTLMGG